MRFATGTMNSLLSLVTDLREIGIGQVDERGEPVHVDRYELLILMRVWWPRLCELIGNESPAARAALGIK